MLAEDEITISIGKGRAREVVFLRPTLRAAMRLERAFGGFDKLIEAILDDNVTAMAAVIREGEGRHSDISRLIESLVGYPLCDAVAEIKAPLIKHVLQLAGHQDDEADEPKGDPIPYAEHYAKLYRLATGWLGWTPEIAWTSTPSEIIEAFKGRTDMLRAVFGSGESNEAPSGVEVAPEVFNAKLEMFFAKASARFPQTEAA